MKLRTDERQWLIYQEPNVTAAVRAVESLCMAVAGPALARHPDEAIRALGHVAMALSEARTKWGLGLNEADESPSELETAAYRAATATLRIIFDPSLAESERTKLLDETGDLHAAMFWLDRRLNGAGTTGPGWYRDLARGR
jgi:hypothetical protein